MQLQPVAMHAFQPEPAQTQPSPRPSGDAEKAPFMRVLEQVEAIGEAQDRRIAADLNAYAKSRNDTAKLLSLLQLQYDLDDMHFSAALAKNVANQFNQALTTITQRT